MAEKMLPLCSKQVCLRYQVAQSLSLTKLGKQDAKDTRYSCRAPRSGTVTKGCALKAEEGCLRFTACRRGAANKEKVPLVGR